MCIRFVPGLYLVHKEKKNSPSHQDDDEDASLNLVGDDCFIALFVRFLKLKEWWRRTSSTRRQPPPFTAVSTWTLRKNSRTTIGLGRDSTSAAVAQSSVATPSWPADRSFSAVARTASAITATGACRISGTDAFDFVVSMSTAVIHDGARLTRMRTPRYYNERKGKKEPQGKTRPTMIAASKTDGWEHHDPAAWWKEASSNELA